MESSDFSCRPTVGSKVPAWLLFLPPHSPNLNVIETAFQGGKSAWLSTDWLRCRDVLLSNSPLAEIRNASSGSGRCSASASATSATRIVQPRPSGEGDGAPFGRHVRAERSAIMFDPSIPSPLSAFSAAVAELVRGAAPSVVSVKSQHSQSSGFVWRPGLVVAAEEALADDGEIEIVAHDGGKNRAELVGRDPSTDVALLRVERTDLPQAAPSAGGAAAGALALVVAAREGAAAASLGIVSYAGPQWRSLRGGLIDARIELSAALRRSSEGGLALDADGQALGMAVFGPRRRTLVIPFSTINRVADVLAAKGRVARGYLGLGLQPVKLETGGTGIMAMSVDPKARPRRPASGRATSSWRGTAKRSAGCIISCGRWGPTASGLRSSFRSSARASRSSSR